MTDTNGINNSTIKTIHKTNTNASTTINPNISNIQKTSVPSINTKNQSTEFQNLKDKYEEQKKLGLFIEPTCPVCFEFVRSSLQPHLLKSHEWRKGEIDLFSASIPLNWKCDQCPNSKFQFGVSMNDHLRKKHGVSVKKASNIVQTYYNNWKSSKLNHSLILFFI